MISRRFVASMWGDVRFIHADRMLPKRKTYLRASWPMLQNVSQVSKCTACVSSNSGYLPLCTPSIQHCQPTARLCTKAEPPEIPQHSPEKGKLIYVGTLSTQVKFVKAFSLSTSILGLAAQPLIYQSMSRLPVVLGVAMGGMFSFFVFLTPVILHFLTKRYVTQIYYAQETGIFTASTYTFFLRERTHKFSAQDVKLLDIPRLFTTLTAGGKPLFVDPSLFLDREAGIHLLGYDQPLDWEIKPEENDIENKNSKN